MRYAITVLVTSALSVLTGAGMAAENSVLLLLRDPVRIVEGPAGGERFLTGDPQFDQRLNAAAVEAVFPEPPRGWRDPAAAAAAGLDRWLHVRFAAAADALDFVAVAARTVVVTEAELEGHCEWFDTTPNDPDFGRQWALRNGFLNAPRAWDRGTVSRTVVAVLDSGADIAHKDLAANVWINPGEVPGNGLDDDLNGLVDDVHGWDFHANDPDPEDNVGHGTHTTGIVGAVGDNGNQVCGVMWSVPVMTVKIGDFNIDWRNAAKGVVYAADMGAKVISMSFGDSRKIDVLETALDYAVALDVLPVAAAGNDSSTRRGYPAGYAHTMAVIASDDRDRRASFSTHGNWCDLAAPGVDILSLAPGNRLATLSGTSMACPFVAGVAGAVRDANRSLDRIDTRWVLNDSAVDLGSAGFDPDFGWGRLDLLAALERAQRLEIAKTQAAPGESVGLHLAEPSLPGGVHVLLPSRLGREDRMPLSGFDPADTRFLPLAQDPLFFGIVLRHSDGLGVFEDFVGVLDASGRHDATLAVPSGNVFRGLDLSFAWVGFDAADLQHVAVISNSQALSIR